MNQVLSSETRIILKTMLACTRLIIAVLLRYASQEHRLANKNMAMTLHEASGMVGTHVIGYIGLNKLLDKENEKPE